MNQVKNSNGGDGPVVQPKRTLERSPPYPWINLKEALEYARMFWDRERRNAAPAVVAYQHWGFSPKSSGGRLVLSALTKFGLLDEEGRGDDRRVKLSRLVLDILLDERPLSPERDAAIKRAALLPAIHADLWREWGAEQPSEANLRTYLVKDRAFNDATVDGFIREYKDTIDFAKLAEGDTMPAKRPGNQPSGESAPIKQGDFVQWTSGGVDQFPEPRRVVGITDDGLWAFVEDSQTGVPMSELSRQEPPRSDPPFPPKGDPAQPPANPFYKAPATPPGPPPVRPGGVQEQKVLDEGTALMQWPDNLSQESVADLEYWLRGILRRLRRKAGLPPDPKENS